MRRPVMLIIVAVTLMALPLAAHFYLQHRITQVATQVLAPFAEAGRIELGSPFVRLDGHFGLESLVIEPRRESLAPTRMGRITVVSPGWDWTLRALHPQESAARMLLARLAQPDGMEPGPPGAGGPTLKLAPPARRLGLEIEDLERGFTGFLPELFEDAGWHSVAFFEAEGCAGSVAWLPEDLRRMGLHYRGVRWRWEYRVTGTNEVHVFSALTAPGVGSLEHTERLYSPAPADHLSNDPGSNRPLGDSVFLRDDGFAQARNRYCAQRDETNLPTFLQRHMAAIERLLRASGLQAGTEVRAAYQRFARDGGTLLLEVPATGPTADAATLADRLQGRVSTLQRDETPALPLRLQTVEPRPFLPGFKGATLDALIDEQDSGQGSDAGIQADATAASAAPGSLRALLRRSRTGFFDASEPAMPAPQETDGEAALANGAAAEPSPGGDPRITPLDDAAPNRDTHGIPLDQLEDHVGQQIRLTLANGRHRVGVIEEVGEETLRLRVSLPSGSATYDIARIHVRRASVLQ